MDDLALPPHFLVLSLLLPSFPSSPCLGMFSAVSFLVLCVSPLVP
jgi:hypothetical protein